MVLDLSTLDKYNMTGIYCSSYNDSVALLDQLMAAGFTWASGDPLTDIPWCIEDNDVCVFVKPYRNAVYYEVGLPETLRAEGVISDEVIIDFSDANSAEPLEVADIKDFSSMLDNLLS